MKYLFLILFHSGCLADPLVNTVAHISGSYMLDSISYSISKTYMSKYEAEVVSAISTLLLGMTYKASEHFPSNTRNSMVENSIGIGLSVGFRYEF